MPLLLHSPTDINHRCKNAFRFFIIFLNKKRVFNVFLFLERFFLFSSGEFCYTNKPSKTLLNLLNSGIKRLSSDGFNMAAIKIIPRRAVALKRFFHINTVILLGNFLFLN